MENLVSSRCAWAKKKKDFYDDLTTIRTRCTSETLKFQPQLTTTVARFLNVEKTGLETSSPEICLQTTLEYEAEIYSFRFVQLLLDALHAQKHERLQTRREKYVCLFCRLKWTFSRTSLSLTSGEYCILLAAFTKMYFNPFRVKPQRHFNDCVYRECVALWCDTWSNVMLLRLFLYFFDWHLTKMKGTANAWLWSFHKFERCKCVDWLKRLSRERHYAPFQVWGRWIDDMGTASSQDSC